MEALNALKTENEILKNVIENTKAEKTAIDELSASFIREIVNLRTQLVIYRNYIDKKESEINLLTSKTKELTGLLEKFEEMKKQEPELSIVQNESQVA